VALTAALGLAAISTSAALGAPEEARSAVVTGAFAGVSGTSFDLSLKDEAGLLLSVEAEGDGFVVLSVSDGRRVNVYATRGAVSKDGDVKARFAHFGIVAIEFRPRGKPRPEEPFPGCHGKPLVRQAGVFTGRIRFHGERGFAEFVADRARGEMVKTPPWHCGGGGHHGEPEAERDEEAVLEASTPGGNVGFYATGRRSTSPRLGSIFFATAIRRFGRLLEIRTAVASPRSPKSFEFDDTLSAATVHPGWPFLGTGVFQRGADGVASWTGSLRVSFLGGDEALTGGRFEASLEPPKRGRPALDTLGGSLRQTDR
jgi:hypothetical protein